MKKSNSLSLFDKSTQKEDNIFHHLPSQIIKLRRRGSSKSSKFIHFEFLKCPFGKIIVASTSQGLCYLDFYENKSKATQRLKEYFPSSELVEQSDAWQTKISSFFNGKNQNMQSMSIHLHGTDFQFQVWKELLNIPFGELSTYGEIAQHIGRPNSSRAVGTAIGSNPIAYIIPCHRVIQKSGMLGGYKWGIQRKKTILAWEAEQISS